MARVVILSRTSKWGLDTDAKLVEQVFREAHTLKSFSISSIDHLDSYQFTNPKPVDIQVHLEVPCRQAWPWAKLNILVVNPEWWPKKAWDWALIAADLVVFKSLHARSLFPEVDSKKCIIIPWRTGVQTLPSFIQNKKEQVLYLVGDSRNKVEAAKLIVDAWRPSWPPLKLWGSKAAINKLHSHIASSSGDIVASSEYRTAEEKQKAQQEAKYHCVASVAEGFGYTMAECAVVGSLPLWSSLHVQDSMWGTVLEGKGRIETRENSNENQETCMFRESPVQISVEAIQAAGDTLFSLSDVEYSQIATAFQKKAFDIQRLFREGWRQAMKLLPSLKKKQQPFVLRRIPKDELPHIAVITITRNRPKWWANMTRNILLSDYPTEKLLWVLVDDGDGMGRIDAQVQTFREKTASIRVEYVSLTKKTTIGVKRNKGCMAALARAPNTEVFVMMDDDDHYPKSSIEARVTYLKDMKKGCVYCSTLPMYDCGRYISAMNVPPMDLSPAERVSEATLAFTKEFWKTKPFPAEANMAEGELFVAERDAETAEIPPDGIIVSFIHGGNSSSRRIPESQEPNGCHYGFSDEYFTYLSETSLA